jgi:predicted nucleic acid-binding protein
VSSTDAPTNRSNGVVADASAIFDLLKNTHLAPALRARLLREDVLLYAPALVDVEVLQTVRRYLLRGQMDLDQAEGILESYATLDIVRFAHDILFFRIWELRDNFTAYDAAYVALAEGLKLPLITLDARLAKAAPPTIRVELF